VAQQEIDAWVVEYNTDRPHQSLGRCTPAERFAARGADTGPALDLTALAQRRVGDDWISRRVASNGVISVSWQQFSVGKHHGGDLVDAHVTDRLLEVWAGNELHLEPSVRRRRRTGAAVMGGAQCVLVRVVVFLPF
jgi:hypothetical protein